MKKEAPIPACLPLTISSCIGSKPGTEGTEPQICSRVSKMNDNLFVSLDRLLLEFVFQYEQDISIKEDTIQRINKCLESIKENKANVSKLREAINKVDEDIAFHYKHSKEIKDSCSNWKPTCDVFHKHEDYIKDQLTAYQETNEKDKIFEKDEQVSNRSSQNSQLLLP